MTSVGVLLMALAPEVDADPSAIQEVSSLAQLREQIGTSRVRVRMAPGVYPLDSATAPNFLEFSGDDAHYDFTGVTITVDTALMTRFQEKVNLLYLAGDRVVLEGLSLETIGNHPAPRDCRAINILGDDVTLTNVSLRLQGSHPYGYGSFLGFGKDASVRPQKMNGIRVSGNNTRLTACRLIMRGFGHGIFIQGSRNVLVKDCYVEGVLRKTDDILAERSGVAHDLGFMQYTGEPIPAGQMTSLSEDGIRAYPADPADESRLTRDIRVENCRVVRMRKGVTLVQASGTNVIDGCDAIECERVGFHVGSNTRVRDCRADARYTQRGVLDIDPGTHAADVEIEVLDSRGHYGNDQLAEIGGSGHRVVLEEAVPAGVPRSLAIRLGTQFKEDAEARDIWVYNVTRAPVVLSPLAESCLVESVGTGEDHGHENRVLELPPQHPSVGEMFEPSDVDWKHPVYQTDFSDPAVLEDWELEGGKRMSIQNDKLVLESPPGATKPSQNTGHLVCWLKQEIPSDFLLEFSFRPQNRQQGLAIVFFNARGIHGESVFDPQLKERDGTFIQYLRSDLNNYHVSYWSGDRGTSHLRKSYGAHVLTVGDDLIVKGAPDEFQTVRIYKRGGAIRVMVDNRIAIAYDDDGVAFGPVWEHSGWIGLRQMSHTVRGEYDHLTVWPLTDGGRVSAGADDPQSAVPDDGGPGSSGRGAGYRMGELLFSDDFEDLNQWHAELEQGGTVRAEAGRLVIDVPRGCTVWYRPVIQGPVMIEFEARVIDSGGPNDRVSDLNCFWMARDTRSPEDIFGHQRTGVFSDYNLLKTYYVGLGGNNNSTTRFRRYVGDVEKRPLLPEHDLQDERYLIQPNEIQTIRLVACNGLIQYLRDGELYFSFNDDQPYTKGWFALRTVANHMEVGNFRVHRLIPAKGS